MCLSGEYFFQKRCGKILKRERNLFCCKNESYGWVNYRLRLKGFLLLKWSEDSITSWNTHYTGLDGSSICLGEIIDSLYDVLSQAWVFGHICREIMSEGRILSTACVSFFVFTWSYFVFKILWFYFIYWEFFYQKSGAFQALINPSFQETFAHWLLVSTCCWFSGISLFARIMKIG